MSTEAVVDTLSYFIWQTSAGRCAVPAKAPVASSRPLALLLPPARSFSFRKQVKTSAFQKQDSKMFLFQKTRQHEVYLSETRQQHVSLSENKTASSFSFSRKTYKINASQNNTE